MNYFSAGKYMAREQAARMGRASQKVQALKRMAADDYDPAPVRSGLQLVIITLDMRTPLFIEHCALLFDVGKQNRYRWMLDMPRYAKMPQYASPGRHIHNKISKLQSRSRNIRALYPPLIEEAHSCKALSLSIAS